MRFFASAFVLLLTVGGCLTGCSDRLEQKVSATTAGRLAAWRASFASDSNAALCSQADAAFQEIRQFVAGERELKRRRGEPVEVGTAAIDDGVRERVNGLPLREVMQLGLELKIRRLKEELAGLEDVVGKNDQLLTRPGDTEARRILDELRARQTGRIEKYREDLAQAERELEPLVARSRRSLLPPKSVETDQSPQLIR